MQISFYVLSDSYAVTDNSTEQSENKGSEIKPALAADAEAVLIFVCKLTQTVLKKSEHSLVIVDDKIDRLKKLDTALWDFEPTSFIPHDLINIDAINTKADTSKPFKPDNNPIDTDNIDAFEVSAPVTLLKSLPERFDGVVLNLASTPLPIQKDSANIPERVLEIITPDESSKQHGRDKYKHYRELGFELNYFPIK